MRRLLLHGVITALGLAATLVSQPIHAAAVDEATAENGRILLPKSTLVAERVVLNPATGNPELVKLAGQPPELDGETAVAKALDFFARHPAAFGLTEPTYELRSVEIRPDPIGGEQAVFHQVYRGIPVFGTMVRVHFDVDGSLRTVNGSIVSEIDLDPVPRFDSHEAERASLRLIAKQTGRDEQLFDVGRAVLMVYRDGLVRGRPGENHLAWEVEVVSSHDIREMVYFDAHDGRLLDQRSEIHHISRAIHQGQFPGLIWSEGDPLPFTGSNPFANGEINELIAASLDTYDLFANMTNGEYLSFDGLDATMNSVYDANNISCPNAIQSGGITAYCEGMVSDDVSAHEWAHAYTAWTHGLIYQWQPGALNESYSDIFGELVDQLNGRGGDLPADVRLGGECSSAGGSPQPTLEITVPPSVAGPYPAGGAVFNPVAPWTVTAPVELVDDATGVSSDACEPITGFSPGSIALIDRGDCLFREKVANAQGVGAVGVIIINNQGDDVIEMGGDLPRLDIPSVFIGQTDGSMLKSELDAGVTATLELSGEFIDSVRWLIGEDTEALGTIRDMWAPFCFGDPDRVSSVNYYCSSDDNGGVHTNSGVPNHAFALLVDGGVSNGTEVGAIGHTKAARIYWRAMSVYQTMVTDFSNHADLLETSCQDLIGAPLYDLGTGAVHPETITAADCAQVAAAITAVEMREDPQQCNFSPLLDPDAPPIPGNLVVYEEGFDVDPGDEWTLSNFGVFPEYDPRDWIWTDEIPAGGSGGAFFALDSVVIGNCLAGSDDQSGVMELTSPVIQIPIGSRSPILAFDHWVATETDWDGGNLKISINDGPFMQISAFHFIFNPYNGRINSGNTNPLKGELAYTGTDEGSFAGSWGQSQIDLGAIAAAGDRIRLRFDFGVDGCNGAVGWFVDNVQVIVDAPSPRNATGRVRP